MDLALNHMVAPRLHWRELFDLARATGARAVELRGDLGRPVFDGDTGATVRAEARGLRILTLAELPRFDAWDDDVARAARTLIAQAVSCGAGGITLIPCNDDRSGTDLRAALRGLAPMLAEAGLTGFIEPLGFATSTLRDKQVAVNAIEAAGPGRFALIHDTFHHALAGGGPVHPRHTGIVHVSGVTHPTEPEMRDADRGLPGARDRLDSAGQLRALAEAGWDGPVSLEPFAPEIHALADPAPAIARAFEHVTAAFTQMEPAT